MLPLLHIIVIFAFSIAVISTRWVWIYIKFKPNLKAFKTYNGSFPTNNTAIYNELLSTSRKLGNRFCAIMGPFPILFTSDPKLYSLLLGSSKHINKGPLYNIFECKLGNTLFLLNGETWRKRRHLLNKAFDYLSLMNYTNIVNNHSNELMKVFEKETRKQSSEVLNLVEKCIFGFTYDNSLGTCTVGEDLSEFIRALELFFKTNICGCLDLFPILSFLKIFIVDYWKERNAMHYMRSQLKTVIRSRRRTEKGKPILIDLLINEMGTNKTLTEDDVIKEIILALDGGFENTAHAIAYTLYSISKNSHVQEKAFKEIFSILGNDIYQQITQDHLREMKYVDLVIKEALRMYTVCPVEARQLHEDVTFEDTVLPKGLSVVFLNFVMHNDPQLYVKPDEFIPERFLPENFGSNRFIYAPFSSGIRQCIGKKFAEVAIKIVVAKTLLHYELVNAQHELRFAINIALTSTNGIKMGIRKRKI